MSEEFCRIKGRVNLYAAIKGIACFVSATLFLFSVLFYLDRYEIISFAWYYSLICGLALGVITGGVVYFVFFPFKNKLAKSLDKKFALSERVQTMVAYSSDNSPMVKLQREDTNAVLSQIKSEIKFKDWWIYLLVVVLALALFVSALCVPGKEPPPPYEEPTVEVDDWKIGALRDVIEYVEKSKMVKLLQEDVVFEIEDIITFISVPYKESEAKSLAKANILNIDSARDGINTLSAVNEAIDNVGDDSFKKLKTALGALKLSASTGAFGEITQGVNRDTFDAFNADFSPKLNTALAGSGIPTDDALYVALLTLKNNLEALDGENEGLTFTKFRERLDAVLLTAAEDIHDALYYQEQNDLVTNKVIEDIKDIFSIDDDELPELNEAESSGDGNKGEDYPDDDDFEVQGGGLGSGETIYGSNDMIYFPDEDRYVEFGYALDHYYQEVMALVTSGALSDEMVDYINEYYAILYGRSDTDTADN